MKTLRKIWIGAALLLAADTVLGAEQKEQKPLPTAGQR
jgi:hypothetical protein